MIMTNKNNINIWELAYFTGRRSESLLYLLLSEDGINYEIIRANLYDSSCMTNPRVLNLILIGRSEVNGYNRKLFFN